MIITIIDNIVTDDQRIYSVNFKNKLPTTILITIILIIIVRTTRPFVRNAVPARTRSRRFRSQCAPPILWHCNYFAVQKYRRRNKNSFQQNISEFGTVPYRIHPENANVVRNISDVVGNSKCSCMDRGLILSARTRSLFSVIFLMYTGIVFVQITNNTFC